MQGGGRVYTDLGEKLHNIGGRERERKGSRMVELGPFGPVEKPVLARERDRERERERERETEREWGWEAGRVEEGTHREKDEKERVTERGREDSGKEREGERKREREIWTERRWGVGETETKRERETERERSRRRRRRGRTRERQVVGREAGRTAAPLG